MIDHIKLRTARVYLTDAAVDRTNTEDGFVRNAYVVGKTRPGTVTLEFCIDTYPLVTIKAKRVDDGRWWVKRIEANLPALLHGHNGRPLTDEQELHLALTRLRHIVARVVTPQSVGRIIPGVGTSNESWIESVECMVQFHDPCHRFLIGSHFGRLKNQQSPTGVYFGQSTKCSTREVALSVYDKLAQLNRGIPYPASSAPTRVEAIFRNGERLAKDAKATQQFSGKPGPLLATLAPSTAHALIQLTLARLSGFGWLPDIDSLAALSKPSRLIAAALGHAIHDPHRLNLAIESYQLVQKPCAKTAANVETELRSFAFRNYVGDPRKIIFPNLADLPAAEVHWPIRECAFETLMRDIQAPVFADPDIVAAWSVSRFLTSVPGPGDLFGSVDAAPPPFSNTL